MSSPNASAWRCLVCGYVHRGPEPPDECPVCGAPKENFEPYVESTPAAAAAAPLRWRCLNCSYVHEGPEPPDECPVCGAPRDAFEPVEEAAGGADATDQPVRVIIVGAGIAGVTAAEAIRSASQAAEIVLLSKEEHLPYYRLNLTRLLAGELTEETLPLHPESWFGEQRIDLQRGVEASEIDLEGRQVLLQGGEAVPFEKLVLAIGAHPFVPPFPGGHREGVTPVRTLDDARRVLEAAAGGARCVVVGGGLLGLETAGALARQGVDVTLLEGHGWLLPRQLNPEAGEALRQHVEAAGITLRRKARTKEIVGDERARGVVLESGDEVPADLVVVATGVRSNSYLARLAGLEVNRGVVVDHSLATTHPDVFAAGDVAEHRGVVYGVWGPSQHQGSIAGMNAVGLGAEFGGIPRSNTLKVLGVELFSIGTVVPEDASFRAVDRETDGGFDRFVFRDTHLVGAVLLGDASASAAVKHAVEAKTDCSELLRGEPNAEDVLEFLESAKG
jgi:nitrite reductase (NADH) large subunit